MVYLVTDCEWQHDMSQFQAASMPAHRYAEENSSAAMLATKRSAGVVPEMNLREGVTCFPLPSRNKAALRRCHQKSEKGYQWTHKKDLCPPKFKKQQKTVPNLLIFI